MSKQNASERGGIGHTPGPWIVAHEKLHAKADPNELIEIRHDRKGPWAETIASLNVYRPVAGGPQCGCGGDPLANAHLIAAAPDLLAACKVAMSHLTSPMAEGRGGLEILAAAADVLRDAITKATTTPPKGA